MESPDSDPPFSIQENIEQKIFMINTIKDCTEAMIHHTHFTARVKFFLNKTGNRQKAIESAMHFMKKIFFFSFCIFVL